MNQSITQLTNRQRHSLYDVAFSYPIDMKKWEKYTKVMGIKMEPENYISNYKDNAYAVLDSLNDKIIDILFTISSRLSPENLSCDGELKKEEFASEERLLLNEWFHYETKYDFSLDPEDFELYYFENKR